MIPYVEVLDKYTLKKFKAVEAQECWFELSYYDVGEFEVYCKASRANLQALKKGNYIMIPNKRYIWVITAVKYTYTAGGARMILAKGYEAKWLLKKRIILTPVELQGTITKAIYGMVNFNLGTGANAARKIVGFTVDTNDLLIDISGTQAPRGNLLEFVSGLLKQYNCGSQVTYENGALKYSILNGNVRNEVRFSQALDNLISSEYQTDDAEVGTSVLVVSTVEDVDYLQSYDTNKTGVDRTEVLVESNLSTKYEDANGNDQETTPDSALYQGWLIEEGKKELANHTEKEEVSGEIDLQNSNYEFDTDFYIGDIVKVQDEYFNFSINPRILKYTIKQDANGYGEEADYGG